MIGISEAEDMVVMLSLVECFESTDDLGDDVFRDDARANIRNVNQGTFLIGHSQNIYLIDMIVLHNPPPKG